MIGVDSYLFCAEKSIASDFKYLKPKVCLCHFGHFLPSKWHQLYKFYIKFKDTRTYGMMGVNPHVFEGNKLIANGLGVLKLLLVSFLRTCAS